MNADPSAVPDRIVPVDPPELQPRASSEERPARAVRGIPVLVLALLGMIVGAGLAVLGVVWVVDDGVALGATVGVLGVLVASAAFLALFGLVVVPPNTARVVTLFGRYVGTLREPGMWCVNPFTVGGREDVSLRVRNFQTDKAKVNDASGSPIEIAAVVVWRVDDTAKAVFDVDSFEQFVVVQSEAAVRHLASQYPYDDTSEEGTDAAVTLRGNADGVADALALELRARLQGAGLEVLETRLTHLAYAPEIAESMLRRQQAQAIVAARRTIVAGAVGLVDAALKSLEDRDVVDLDPERRAAMVSNMMVVLAGDGQATPVVNVGSLY
jgi:regulator of protease activity HflC (stomatin/prohibitin superfamily)